MTKERVMLFTLVIAITVGAVIMWMHYHPDKTVQVGTEEEVSDLVHREIKDAEPLSEDSAAVFTKADYVTIEKVVRTTIDDGDGITGTDRVGHAVTTSITTKYDITKPGIDGTEITDVINGVTVSGYCQDNIIDQHIDDEASRSVNHPNCTSGLQSILVYKVKNGVKTAIRLPQTQATFGATDTHSAFDVYYDVNETDEYMDYYLVTVKDYAGNINTKKLTTQRSLLTWFHTSIEKSSYGN